MTTAQRHEKTLEDSRSFETCIVAMKDGGYDVVVIGATRAGVAAVESALGRGLSVAIVDTSPDLRILERHCAELRSRTSALRGALGDMNASAKLLREASRQVWRELASPEWQSSKRPIFDASMGEVDCDVYQGPIRFLSPSVLRLDDERELKANAVVISVGSSPRRPATLDFSFHEICDVHQLVREEEPPRSITIVGADWAGCEWAFVCASVGAEVTLIDRRSRMLRAVDFEIRSLLQTRLLDMGVDVVLDERIASLETGSHGECQIQLESGRRQVSERLLVLAGRCGNTEGLGLHELGVQMDESNHIAIDDDYQSTVDQIFAIGDVVDPLGLGHAASLQAEGAIASAVRDPVKASPYEPAWVLHSAAEIAMCGLTQEVCGTLDLEIVSGTATSEEGKGGSLRLAKVVVDARNGRLLGAQLAGPGASEAIGLAASLVGREVDIEECARIGGPEGTLVELWSQAIRLAIVELHRGALGLGRSEDDSRRQPRESDSRTSVRQPSRIIGGFLSPRSK